MKKILSLILAIILVCACSIPAFAQSYNGNEIINPGSIITLTKDQFALDGIMINDYVPLTSTYFRINSKRFARGANLVKDIRISNRNQEVQIFIGGDENTVAPDYPNLILTDLSLRCIRSVKSNDGSYIIKSGEIFKIQEVIELTVGAVPEIVPFDSYGGFISLVSGENKFVQFAGDKATYGDVDVEFSNHARGKMRVYDGTKGFLYFDDDTDPGLASLNTNAYIWTLNMGDRRLPERMKLYLYAGPNDYVYQNTNGSLRLLNNDMKYNDDEGAWELITSVGKYLVISDKPLYSTGSMPKPKEPHYTPEDEEYWINKYNQPGDDFEVIGGIGGGYDTTEYNPNLNPSTGGPQVSPLKTMASVAITAISCITVISIATASLIFAKKNNSPKDEKKIIKIKRKNK